MARWWEIAIPASSALVGVGVTAGWAAINARKQRNNERNLKFLEHKRSIYSQFRSTALDVRTFAVAASRSQIASDKAIAAMEAYRTELAERNSEDTVGRARALMDAGLTDADRAIWSVIKPPDDHWQHLRAALALMEESSRAAKVLADSVPDQREIRSTIAHLAPLKVRRAADRVAVETHRNHDSDVDFLAAIEVFDSEVRRDLGIRS